MAALQSIRNKGVLLIVAIGVALFAFIAEEFFRSLETTSNQSKQQIGEVYDETLSVQEYQALIKDYTEAFKFMRGVTSLSERENDQLKDEVWQNYVDNTIVKEQCEELGITITEDEIAHVLQDGTNRLLLQTPFRNQKTGKFDLAALQKFLTDYKAMQTQAGKVPGEYLEQYSKLYSYWKFIEKSLKQQILLEKYNVLLAKSVISNKISAKASFDEMNEKNNLTVLAVPYSSIQDKDITVTDADLQKMYNEKKDRYQSFNETRDIKYISVKVEASKEDKAELQKEIDEASKKLATATNYANIIRSYKSTIPFQKVAVTKNAFPQDIQEKLETAEVGKVVEPFESTADNTLNTLKVISKTLAPDTIEYCQIQIGGMDKATTQAKADSVMNELKKGAKFEDVAKAFQQTGKPSKISSSNYETSSLDESTAKLITVLNELGENKTKNIAIAQGNIIVKVIKRSNIVNKYKVAVVKCPITFSNTTYSKAYNKFSSFIAQNKTIEDIKGNAIKNGYQLKTRSELQSNEHYVANLTETSETMKWIFAAEEGEVSPLYECGEKDHLLLVALTKIHPEGIRPLEDIKPVLKQFVLKEKKAEKIIANLKEIKSIDEAQKVSGCVVDSLNNVTFASAPFVNVTGSAEPIISGALNTPVNTLSTPLEGNRGVYRIAINAKTKGENEYNEKAQMGQQAQFNLRVISQFMQELYIHANIKDRRYLYF